MSKSAEGEGHAILVLDPPNVIKKKIMRATTESGREIAFSRDPEKAGVNNLLTIYQALTHESQASVESQFAGKGYGDLKKAVVEVVVAELEPLQTRYHALMSDTGYLEEVLAQGAEQAATVAEKTLKDVKDRVGFLAPARRWPVNGK
jgi:tryptophanyl-tRNA synthetase